MIAFFVIGTVFFIVLHRLNFTPNCTVIGQNITRIVHKKNLLTIPIRIIFF